MILGFSGVKQLDSHFRVGDALCRSSPVSMGLDSHED